MIGRLGVAIVAKAGKTSETIALSNRTEVLMTIRYGRDCQTVIN